jgi:hypothetical protein
MKAKIYQGTQCRKSQAVPKACLREAGMGISRERHGQWSALAAPSPIYSGDKAEARSDLTEHIVEWRA